VKRQRGRDRGEETQVERQRGEIQEERNTRGGWEETEEHRKRERKPGGRKEPEARKINRSAKVRAQKSQQRESKSANFKSIKRAQAQARKIRPGAQKRRCEGPKKRVPSFDEQVYIFTSNDLILHKALASKLSMYADVVDLPRPVISQSTQMSLSAVESRLGSLYLVPVILTSAKGCTCQVPVYYNKKV
jgi:hypothetical protein